MYRCPSCQKKFQEKSRAFPFCSERCKLIDLGAWASEKYKINGKELDDAISEESSKDDTPRKLVH